MKRTLTILAACLLLAALCRAQMPVIFAQMYGSGSNPNLVGWWKLDGNGTDSSGNNNTGTLVNSPTNAWDHNGAANSALGFDSAATQYVSIATAAGLDITNRPLTLMAWVRSTATASTYVLSRNRDSGATIQYGFLLVDGTKPQFALEGGVRVQDDIPLPLSAWTHICCVWASDGKPSIYTNAVLAATNTVYTAALTTRANTSIGRRSNAADGSTSAALFTGQVDDVRVYKQDLTAAQIATAMNGGQP